MPADELHEVWSTKLKEGVDQYQPDMIWFDSWLDKIPESYRQRFAAYYLNEASNGPKAKVQLIGHRGTLKHSVNVDGRLVIQLPDLPESRRLSQHTYSFKLTGFELNGIPQVLC